MIRTILSVSILLAVLMQWWFLAALLTLWCLIRFNAYELIALGILFDAYYGAFASLPLYSVGSLVTVLVTENIKPRFLLYTDQNAPLS